MIPDIKTYVIGAIVIALLTVTGLSRWELSRVKKEYVEYKETIDEQVLTAKIAAAAIKKLQDAKFDKVRTEYANSSRDLADILGRLRDGSFVLREDAVQLPDSGGYTMPAKTGDTTGIIDPAQIEAGIRQTSFYALSMQDALQCSMLIELVR